ncbi:Hsp20/alpha crystallin family protein [Halobacteriaceae archaeon GCM10025711]
MTYNPFDEMDRMLTEMDDWFTGMRGQFRAGDRTGFPSRNWLSASDIALDVHEEDDMYVLVADMPGFEKDEIDLRLTDDALTIEAHHEVTSEAHTRSRRVFERVTLPMDAGDEDITATYRNGVLEVHVPKVETAETGTRIDVE